jgi:hypothetical protein
VVPRAQVSGNHAGLVPGDLGGGNHGPVCYDGER